MLSLVLQREQNFEHGRENRTRKHILKQKNLFDLRRRAMEQKTAIGLLESSRHRKMLGVSML